MNTNYQKTGIRLRHLEQEQGDARSLSPMTANRKKIFEKPVQTNVISRNTAQYVDEPSNLHTNNIEFEYDQLV